MPLERGSSRKAFSHNIETEMSHGNPQRQAVAVAYRQAREKAQGGEVMCAHGGPIMCDQGCYAEGGDVKGVHKPYGEGMEGQSVAGRFARGAKEGKDPLMSKGTMLDVSKAEHGRVLNEMKSMKKPKLYAQGGDVGKLEREYSGGMREQSMAGQKRPDPNARMLPSEAESEAAEGSMPGMPERNLMAEGGESEGMDDDSMISDQVCHEMMEALHSKDAAAFKDGLMALIADCLMKMKED
jgi:hypothetical protein